MRTAADTGPKRIGPYEVHGEISSGGMGRVHVGRRLGASGFQKPVAIKRLLPMLAADPEFAKSFVDEAHLASRVAHRNIVPTLDLYKEATEVLLVMELVVGASLEELASEARRRETRIPVPIVVSLLLDILAGLHAMHSATDPSGLGILHRDISPHNVLVGLDGTARLVDFGIAKVFSTTEGTNTHTVKGKLAYMAPEQMLLMPLGPRADLYSVGVVAWELLTNKRFRGGMQRVEQALFALTGEGVKMPGAVLEDPTLAPLDAILKRVLATEPADRFESAAEMAAALESTVVAARTTHVAAWVAEWGTTGVEKLNGLIRGMGDQSIVPPDDASGTPPTDGPTQVGVTKGMAADGHSAESSATLASPRVRAALGAVLAASAALLVIFLVQRRFTDLDAKPAQPFANEPSPPASAIATAGPLPTVAPVEPAASTQIASASAPTAAPTQRPAGRPRQPPPPPPPKKNCRNAKVFNDKTQIWEATTVCD